jgi:hypothetical protein
MTNAQGNSVRYATSSSLEVVSSPTSKQAESPCLSRLCAAGIPVYSCSRSPSILAAVVIRNEPLHGFVWLLLPQSTAWASGPDFVTGDRYVDPVHASNRGRPSLMKYRWCCGCLQLRCLQHAMFAVSHVIHGITPGASVALAMRPHAHGAHLVLCAMCGTLCSKTE